MTIVNHGIVLRLKVNQEQESILNQSVGNARWVYNEALTSQICNYNNTGKFLSSNELSKMLPKLKQDPNYEWLKISDATSLQNSLRDLEQSIDDLVSNSDSDFGGEFLEDM